MSDTTGSADLLQFNGINAATGQYGLELTLDELAAQVSGVSDKQWLNQLKLRTQNDFALRSDLRPEDLSQAGWGIVFPQQSNPQIQEALAELIDLRREQAGDLFRLFAGEDGYRLGESKDEFLSRFGVGPGIVDPELGVPYYLLLVGGPGDIPFDFQYQLDVQFAVGRIYFKTLQEYANYARSVVTAETEGLRLPRQMALFGVTNPDDRATQLSTRQLVQPLAATVQKESQKLAERRGEAWQVAAHTGDDATKSRLLELLHSDQAPALLFSASHGMEFPLGDPRQIHEQGGLLCSDWPGPVEHRGPIPRDWYLTAEDIPSDANLLGLISFNFACYGAGTPHHDEFGRAGQPPEAIAPYPFMAALPTRLLGLPKGGALAVVGHVERAWGYSIAWPGVGASTTAFENAARLLMKRFPVGFALEAFDLRYAELATELTMLINRREKDAYKLAGAWTAHNDARSYVVLGDPAVRLPLAQKAEPATTRPTIEVQPLLANAAPPPLADEPEAQPQPEPPPSDAPVFAADEALAFALWGSSKTPEQPDAPGPLQEFLKKLGGFMVKMLDDTTTLAVDTYVSQDLDEVTYSGGKFEGANLRASSRITVDGDTRLCVPQDEDGDIDQALWAIHMEAVRQAQASRAELVKTAISAGTGLFNLWKPGS